MSRSGLSEVFAVRVLMTGGYGCIGSWVAKQLVDDRGTRSGSTTSRKTRTGSTCCSTPSSEAESISLPGTSPTPIRCGRRSSGVEATHLLHLAGLQVPTCRANPILGAQVNVIGTLAVFEAAVALKGQVERVVYASSAAVTARPIRTAPTHSATRSACAR